MKKVLLIVAIVVVVALGTALTVLYYLRSQGPASPATTPNEPAQAAAPAQGKENEFTPEAATELEEINRIQDADARQDRLIQFYQRYDIDKAIALVEDAIKAKPDPDNWLPNARLVEFYVQKGDLEKAEANLKNVMEKGAQEAYGCRTAAKFYMQKKDFAKAAAMLDKALGFSKDDENRAFTYSYIAELNLQQGEKAKARENLQKAVKLAPANEHFKALISQIDEANAQ
jgi:hypothetical protein